MTIRQSPRHLRMQLLREQIRRLALELQVLETAELPETTSNHPDCGTERGYKRHGRYGEATCQPCRDAHRVYVRTQKAQKLMGAS